MPESRPKKTRSASKGRPAKRKNGKLVAILSRKRSLYSTRRLVEAVQQRGHRSIVLDTLRCNLIIVPGNQRMVYRDAEVNGVDVVIPRIGASVTSYGLAVVNHFDMMGVPVVNNSVPIARSRDKLRCLQLLAKFGVLVPRTVMAHQRCNVDRLIREVGGLPVIVKLLRGTQGVGVMLGNTLQEVRSMLETFWQLGQEVLVQEFVAESKGRDVRALVVGDEVVATMRRVARQGEFRSNLHRGGEGTVVKLSRAHAEVAVRATRIVGLEVAGVDMLETSKGPLVMEINSSPGFEGIEKATGADIAGRIIDHALAFASAQHAGFSKQRLV